ncbi:MAG: transposase [Ruminococcus sp.]
MEATGHIMHGGTIVDATIISAPSSTKNAERNRIRKCIRPKGNVWKFGMKCHIGVDSGSGLVHTITATAANTHDIAEAHKLLREDDHVVYGDSGYIGIEKQDEIKNNEHFRKIDFRINRRPKPAASI